MAPQCRNVLAGAFRRARSPWSSDTGCWQLPASPARGGSGVPNTGDSPSYAADIRPLFRDNDRTSMLQAFDLWSFEDVTSHADAIFARVADGSMPCDGPWAPAN